MLMTDERSPPITLYRLQGCPYCERVVRALDEFGLKYQSRFVEPRHSRRNIVRRVTGGRTVPAIVDDRSAVVMNESENIVEYLKSTYSNERSERVLKPPEETA